MTPTTPSPLRSATQTPVHPKSPKATSTSLTAMTPLPSKSPGQGAGYSQLPSSRVAEGL